MLCLLRPRVLLPGSWPRTTSLHSRSSLGVQVFRVFLPLGAAVEDNALPGFRFSFRFRELVLHVARPWRSAPSDPKPSTTLEHPQLNAAETAAVPTAWETNRLSSCIHFTSAHSVDSAWPSARSQISMCASGIKYVHMYVRMYTRREMYVIRRLACLVPPPTPEAGLIHCIPAAPRTAFAPMACATGIAGYAAGLGVGFSAWGEGSGFTA